MKNRVVFLDLMRAFAVLMMVQGHTIDALLSPEYRSFDSVLYSIWHTMRGFTAPIFMFTSGVVFTYLLRLKNVPFSENPRIRKGFKRVLLLLGIGYFLRYPTFFLFNLWDVQYKQWLVFFSVDALHLIAFGLLFTITAVYISEKAKLSFYGVSAFMALLFFGMYPVALQINWIDHLPLPFAAYFYRDYGSLFPLFPWAGYVLAGSFLGNYLAVNKQAYMQKRFAFNLLLAGGVMILSADLVKNLINLSIETERYLGYETSVAFFRLGIVLLINSGMVLLARKVTMLPKLVTDIGANTLPIYVVHLIILYGSAWSPGVNIHLSKVIGVEGTIAAAVIMEVLMISLVVFIEKYKSRMKAKLAASEA